MTQAEVGKLVFGTFMYDSIRYAESTATRREAKFFVLCLCLIVLTQESTLPPTLVQVSFMSSYSPYAEIA